MADWEDRNVKDSWEDEDEIPRQVVKNSWDDEDEVKESWEDEEKPVEIKKPVAKPTKKEPTQPIKDVKDMTEEEKKEAQLKADLEHTNELFGLSKSLDEMSLKSKEDYQDYIDRFYARVNINSTSPLYVDFLDDLFKTLCKNLSGDAVKKIANSLRIVYENKLAEEKQNKKKEEKPKPKSKGRIKMEFDRIKSDFDSFLKDSNTVGYDDYDEADDFM